MKLTTITLLIIFAGLFFLPSTALAQSSPPVLAFYYAWFDQNTWTSGQAVDTPAQPYTSADRATIERQVAQAQSAGIDAFVQSWYGPQEANNQTETNFRALLNVAQSTSFKAAVDVEVAGPFLGDKAAVTQALQTLLATHAQHPAYLRYQGQPVIFFWRQNRFTVDEWANIRQQVDPQHASYWIAEGTDIAYQSVFDGHHLYSIAWAASPADQLTKWGNRVRAYESDHQLNRLWVATAMPGYDDTRLPRADAFAVPRRSGDYYRETWRGAVASKPAMIIITSFNEWPEGTQIEPSAAYGNLYLDVTRELVSALRGSPPPSPVVAAAALTQTTPVTPTGPYIKADKVTNARRAPSTTADKIGELPANSLTPVIGRVEGWWQIEFQTDPAGKGWVSAEVVEFVGDSTAVPEVAPPPTAAAGTPPAVSLTITPTTTVTTPQAQIPAGGTNVRSGPGLNFDLLGRLDEGQVAPVVGKNETGEWWQIKYSTGKNGLGWVANAVVDIVGDTQSVPVVGNVTESGQVTLPTATPTPLPTVIVGNIKVIDPVNVRAEPSLEGVIVGGLYPGEIAPVLAVSADSAWWQIEFADGPDGAGWVAAEFVQFEGEKTTVPIFGIGTPTPTPGPTNTPTATPVLPTFTPLPLPTYAPTATSVYQATSAAELSARGTPDPALTETSTTTGSWINWTNLPLGILSALVVAGLLWYQFRRRR